MTLTNYALDKFVSQQLSELTECNAPNAEDHYSQAKFWVSNFVLNSIFGGSASKERRTFTFFFLRRAEAAFTEYEYAILRFVRDSIDTMCRRVINARRAVHTSLRTTDLSLKSLVSLHIPKF